MGQVEKQLLERETRTGWRTVTDPSQAQVNKAPILKMNLMNQCQIEPIRFQNVFLSDGLDHSSDSERMQPYHMLSLRAQRPGLPGVSFE